MLGGPRSSILNRTRDLWCASAVRRLKEPRGKWHVADFQKMISANVSKVRHAHIMKINAHSRNKSFWCWCKSENLRLLVTSIKVGLLIINVYMSANLPVSYLDYQGVRRQFPNISYKQKGVTSIKMDEMTLESKSTTDRDSSLKSIEHVVMLLQAS